MIYRLADGGDKIAAFERGATDAEMALAFETPGTVAYVVNETFLVAYELAGNALWCMYRRRLYGTGDGAKVVEDFLAQEAGTFGVLAWSSCVK